MILGTLRNTDRAAISDCDHSGLHSDDHRVGDDRGTNENQREHQGVFLRKLGNRPTDLGPLLTHHCHIADSFLFTAGSR